MYDDRATHAQPPDAAETGRVTFRNVLAFRNFILMMGVIFGLQFVDRSFGPVLPLYVEQIGVTPRQRRDRLGRAVLDHGVHRRARPSFLRQAAAPLSGRAVIAGGAAVAAAGAGLFGLSGSVWIMAAASVLLGLGIGAAMTASYSAAGAVIPPGAHGAGFGVLTSASLVGMASSPFIAGFVGGASIRDRLLRRPRADGPARRPSCRRR